jgi:hypothetical protein
MTGQASLADQVMRPIYEQIRDGMPHKEARELWREADMRVEHTRWLIQDVHDDESLSEEGKDEKAQRIIDASRFGVGTRSGSSERRRNGDA